MVPGVEIVLIVIWAQQFLHLNKNPVCKSYRNNSQFSEVFRTDSFHKLTTQLIQPPDQLWLMLNNLLKYL